MKRLETERIVLRPWRESDADDFYEYARSPEVGPPAGWQPHESREESLRVLRTFIEKDEVWAIALRQRDKVIGSLGLHPDSRRGNDGARMLGYALGREYWGQGLMSEAVRAALHHAFMEQGLNLVSVWHADFNTRSQRVIEKAGFRFEGRLRRARVRFDGLLCDDMCYSMTREEYLAGRE